MDASEETPILLIVDDEPIVAETTARVLACEFSAMEILIATSPEEGIEVIQNRPVAILISDLSMPRIDGTEVIRNAFEKDRRTVSILITGHATKDSMIKAINEGHLWKCIEKPWKMDQLLAVVQDALATYNERLSVAEFVEHHQPKQAPAARMRFSPNEPPRKTSHTHRPKQLFLNKPRPSAAPAARMMNKKAAPKFRLAPKGSGTPRQEAPRDTSKVDERYTDLTLISEGGTGSVYKAQDKLLGMPVAVKVISENYAKDEEAMKVLFNEARIAMQLSHKHIVRLHNIHESRGLYYLVMEFIDGSTLRKVLDDSGPLAPATVKQIVDICDDTLGYAHRHQVYHRDLKPENFMVSNDGVLKIIDFGVACLAIHGMKEREDVYGTPYYMSPEEMAGQPLDQRTDIYSLGVMIHEFLTGNVPPHGGKSPMTDYSTYVPKSDESLPSSIQTMLQKSFSPNPAQRHLTVAEFAADFRNAFVQGYPNESE